MPKPINQTIGRCQCSTPGCGLSAHVRKMRGNGRLYLVCSECGTIRPTGQRFQDYILDNAEMMAPGGTGQEPGPEPEPEPEPELEQESKPKKSAEPVQAPAPAPATDRGRRQGGILEYFNDWEI